MNVVVAAAALAATSVLGPPRVAPATGWYSGTGSARACVGVASERCTESWAWTATVRWRDCRSCVPRRTLSILPRDGVAVTVTRVRERPVAARREIEWPPRIAVGAVAAGMEGIPRRYGVYQLFARLANRDEVMVWAYFGRSRPTSAQLAAANRRLRAARVP